MNRPHRIQAVVKAFLDSLDEVDEPEPPPPPEKPLIGRDDSIPFDRFDAKLIETVKPLRIYSDEYGICFMTCKDWYNGEHGIFIAKDGENMQPDINWGLIDGRIYTYAIYD